MSLETVKRVASRIYKVGETRVKIMDAVKAQQALTADDIRALVKEGAVKITAARGSSRAAARFKQSRVHAGRRRGSGSAKGNVASLEKDQWIAKIRSQRALLKGLKPRIKEGEFRKVYYLIKGNVFKSKKSLLSYLQTNQLLK